ncbi:MAG: ABC transporter ATP-binding protein/permease [Defluviitaleaceae bacterium]|nr:ABC transporter ATP-binding protein/permease [Defluviitaleaceae bacterium]
MTDTSSKLTFRETIGLIGYGYKLINKMTPAYIPTMIIRALIIAAQPLMVLFFSARILNELAGAQDVRAIIIYAGLTVGLTFVLSVLRAILTREIETTSNFERLFHLMQMMQAERFMRMDFVHAEDSKVSEVLARMDTQAMGNGLGLMNIFFVSAMLAEQLFSLIFAILLMTGLSAGGGITGLQTAILSGVFGIGLIINIKYRLKQQVVLENMFKENMKANTAGKYYRTYIQAGEAAKDVRIYNQNEALSDIFRNSFSAKAWLSFFFFDGRIGGFSLAMLSIVGGGFYLFAGHNALGGTATIGGIVQTVGAAMAMATAIGTLVTACGQLYNNGAFMRPMRDFMTLPDVLVKGTRPVPPPPAKGYQFEFRNVSFRYPAAEDYALSKLNLKINAGQRMAVVGLNGSGKTTMIKLLCRLYDPTEGEILLDGVNIKEYNYEEYVALFSVVFQDYLLFPLWLGENVAAGDNYDEKRVKTCLDEAGFLERLNTMEAGLQTVLFKTFDEDGTQISGGEAQKIALARALYKDAPMVVFDEPTAALDPIAEYEVYTTFDKTIGDKTAVFISHRLSSCRFCHDIAVFDSGRLVQRGSHESLLADKHGLYHELWDAQAKHYV